MHASKPIPSCIFGVKTTLAGINMRNESIGGHDRRSVRLAMVCVGILLCVFLYQTGHAVGAVYRFGGAGPVVNRDAIIVAVHMVRLQVERLMVAVNGVVKIT
jgi:hypothetical protein